MRKYFIILIAITIFCTLTGNAFSLEVIDLSNVENDTIIKAPGGSFAQAFAGEIFSYPELQGLPSNPLRLEPVGDLFIQPFGKINSIYSDMTYTGPLSVLLDNVATSLSFSMGHGQPPSSVRIDFFASDGTLVHTVKQEILRDYNTYSFKTPKEFRGFTIHRSNDPGGLRYYNFKYDCI